MALIRLETVIAAPRAACFALSLSIDAHTASTSGSRERAVAGVTAGRIGLGESVTWKAWHFGLPWRMTSKITELDEPLHFVDEQIRGPFAYWRHEHRFEHDGSGTLMIDTVEYASPLGPLGHIADRLFVERHLVKFLSERNAWLKTELEAADPR